MDIKEVVLIEFEVVHGMTGDEVGSDARKWLELVELHRLSEVGTSINNHT